jgi:hypothetical protein
VKTRKQQKKTPPGANAITQKRQKEEERMKTKRRVTGFVFLYHGHQAVTQTLFVCFNSASQTMNNTHNK